MMRLASPASLPAQPPTRAPAFQSHKTRPLGRHVFAELRRGSPVLVVDADPFTRRALATVLKQRSFRVSTAAHPADALDAIELEVPAVLLVNLAPPAIHELSDGLRQRGLDLPVLVIMGPTHPHGTGPEQGANATYIRPLDLELLLGPEPELLQSA